MYIRLVISVCLLLSFDAYLVGQSSFSDQLKDLLEDSRSESAAFGISIKALDGEVLYQHQPKTRFIPASTFKLITSLSALDILGADYSYATSVGYIGTVAEDGVLAGDIVIKGSGDPSLAAIEMDDQATLDQLLSKVLSMIRKKGITCVTGSLMVDGTFFDSQGIHPSWPWDDLTNYYASGAYGINVHQNLYKLSFKRTNIAHQETTIEKIEPSVPGLDIRNQVSTGPMGSGDNAYIYGDPYSNKRWVEGTIPPGKGQFSIKGAIPDPMAFLGHHLVTRLVDSGIQVNGYKVAKEKSGAIEPLGSIRSKPLSALATFANHTSNNLFCEAFFKTIGATKTGEGSYITGREALEAYLREAQLDLSGIRIEDGSGLSARNRVSPEFMTEFLAYQIRSNGLEKVKQYIPKTGLQGSVRRFLNGYEAQESCWLKSGSINNVLAYAGILEGKSKQPILISIVANGHDSNRNLRGQMERIIETIYQEF